MASDDDFTFCQVGSPADQSGLEAQKSMPGDESASDANCTQHNGILWKDKVPSNAISKKAATVGSLSFNVIGTSPREQSTELPKGATPEDTDNSVSKPQQQKTPVLESLHLKQRFLLRRAIAKWIDLKE